MKVVFSWRARVDIAKIYDTIADNNPKAAQRVENVIRAKCERLGEFPQSAQRTDEPNLYRLPVGRYPYTIFYRINAEIGRVEIVRVVHGARVRNLKRMP